MRLLFNWETVSLGNGKPRVIFPRDFKACHAIASGVSSVNTEKPSCSSLLFWARWHTHTRTSQLKHPWAEQLGIHQKKHSRVWRGKRRTLQENCWRGTCGRDQGLALLPGENPTCPFQPHVRKSQRVTPALCIHPRGQTQQEAPRSGDPMPGKKTFYSVGLSPCLPAWAATSSKPERDGLGVNAMRCLISNLAAVVFASLVGHRHPVPLLTHRHFCPPSGS